MLIIVQQSLLSVEVYFALPIIVGKDADVP